MYFIFIFAFFPCHHYTFAITTVNVTVATDGTGDFDSIHAAIASAPNKSALPYTIYIKEGVYSGPFYIGPEKTNLIVFGDGINKTILTSNRSNSGGFNIQESAALDISTDHFLAKNISIINTAGPDAGLAVALRTAGQYLAFYACSIEGYQDTVFTVSGDAQFFYNCHIYGTVDFIFGDAKAVFQNSIIYSRKRPQPWQNVITAQGRQAEKRNTAFVIHNCTLTAAPGYDPNVKTFMGRPWKNFSRTIVMESYLDSLIDAEGWMKWDGELYLNTLYYAEYKNHGPGLSIKDRVTWPGYQILNSPNEVQNFSVNRFIDGSNWLPQIGVPFIGGLIG